VPTSRSQIAFMRLDGGAQDPGAGGLEDGVERGGEVRPVVADEELNVLEALAEAEGEVAGLLYGPLARRARGDACGVPELVQSA